MFFALKVLSGLAFVSFVGPLAVRAALDNFFAALGLIMVLIIAGVAVVAIEGYHKIECVFGDQEACYFRSYYDSVRLENHRRGDVNNFYENSNAAHNPALNDETLWAKTHRWSFLREEWYKGQVVTTRELCLMRAYENPLRSDTERKCFYRYVIDGPYKGDYNPHMHDSNKIATQEDIEKNYRVMLPAWNAAR